MPLRDMRLIVSPFREWQKRDWTTILADADEPLKRILTIQKHHIEILCELDDAPADAARLAWVALWSRAFQLIEGARESLFSQSATLIDPLHRMAFELMLHVVTIRNPLDSLIALRDKRGANVGPAAFDEAYAEVRTRLAGYLAWCLSEELQYLNARTQARELARVYVKTDPRIAREDPTVRSMRELLFGPVEIVSEQEAAGDRAAALLEIERRIARRTDWLEDEQLAPWRKKIVKIMEGERSKSLPSLHRVFGTNAQSVREMLKDLGMEHRYGEYALSSMILHGSYLPRAVELQHPTLVPRFAVDPREREESALALAQLANVATLGLWGIQKTVA